jgi:hypothetical protein
MPTIKQLSYIHLNIKYMAMDLFKRSYLKRETMDSISEQIKVLIAPFFDFQILHSYK